MLILDTELDNTTELPSVRQILQSWAARLWSWLHRQPKPEIERKDSESAQNRGRGLVL
jgi:hypothetical protein